MKDTVLRPGGRVALICMEDMLGQAMEQSLDRDGRSLSRSPCDPDALEALREDCPDVIIVETRTADAAGLSLCQAIRQSRDLDTAKLLVLQNSGRPIDKRRAQAMGADGFLSIPFPMSTLRYEVGRLLEA